MTKNSIKLATDTSRDGREYVLWLFREKKLRCMRITYTHIAVSTIFSLNISLQENSFNFVHLPLPAQNGLKCETREICLVKSPQQCE